MKITILGSASGQAIPNRNASACLVESKGHLFLIDSGDGVTQQLARYKINLNQIVSIFISHTHSDHLTGIFLLLQNMNLTGRKKKLKIFLPKGILPGFNSIFPYFQIFQEKWSFQFDLVPITEITPIKEKGFHVIAIANDHVTNNKDIAKKKGIELNSYSFYLTDDSSGSVIYTSDINSLDHLYPDSFDANILISECTHIQIEEVLAFARSTNIRRVVFTHIPPEIDNYPSKLAEIPMPMVVQFAKDGDIIII
jgi:ribonuclease BN (tRNA processing enzyme)